MAKLQYLKYGWNFAARFPNEILVLSINCRRKNPAKIVS